MKRIVFLTAVITLALQARSQNVGIGITTPQVPLHIKSTTYSDVLRVEGITPRITFWNVGTPDGGGALSAKSTGMDLSSHLPFSGTALPVTISPGNTTTTTFLPNGNVGIGVTVPIAKLEVMNPGKSTVRVSSTSYTDTTRLMLSNRTIGGAGTDFILSSNQETGLNISSASDLLANTNSSILFLNPQGNVGIGNSNPINRLDVAGNINVTGAIKANGIPGNAGQFLTSNGAGSMSWSNSGGFQNQVVYGVSSFPGAPADYNWPVPAGISKIQVEIWSGGGHGGFSYSNDSVNTYETFQTTGGGGGGGGYATALLSVSAGQVMAIHVPAGGEGGYASIINGGNAIYMNNGNDGSNAYGSGGLGGNFGGTTGSFLNVSWLKGENGAYYTKSRNKYSNGTDGSVITTTIGFYGNGGASANNNSSRGTGGYRNEEVTNEI
ncbi:MAG TPA: hypothetical protein VK498_07235, partial [Ferruginibacter sp.]|nr:hypothetical protein [Ferruginibacter sp.]